MRRVTREDRQVGQINQLSGNKMGGVKSIDMRAHGTQKTKTNASKTNHQPCAKQDMNTQLMRILISRVHTRHDNIKARSR